MSKRSKSNLRTALQARYKTQFSSKPQSRRTVIGRTITASALSLCAFHPLARTARADAYHAVEAGETLSAIASRYGTNIETLRTANKLQMLRDNSPLPSMLLRVPGADASASSFNSSPSLTPAQNGRPTLSPAPSSGSISRSVRYIVKEGDTLESIAGFYAGKGNDVSVESIRCKNNVTGVPKAGGTLLIPLGSASYAAPRANAQVRAPRNNWDSTREAAVQISEEIDWPVAQVITPAQEPVYQAPNAVRVTKVQAKKARRGPTSLASRGYFPSPNLDGARVLGQGEEANAAPRSRSRVITAPQAPQSKTQKLARVAKITTNGARIRRLPESSAVTLYNCPVNTELAVIKQNGPWSAILMSDRSTGWIPTHYMRYTGASVDISSQVMTTASPGGAPDRRFSSNAYYASASPMVAQALSWLGTRYVYGGESRRGIDCSALVQNSFRSCGYRLPRTAAQQARVGAPVDPANLRAGDRLYFSASGSRVDHTGLYMGDGLFVHASGSGRQVMVSNLFARRNWNIFVGARR